MANLICAKCNKPIDENNLMECPHCWEMYHKDCWEETKFCLNCKKYNLDFARIQADREETELKATDEKNFKIEVLDEKEEEEKEEEIFEMPTRELNHSPIANTMTLVSKIVLILGVVAGIALGADSVLKSYSIMDAIPGAILGVVMCAAGWVVSVLVNGFADLVNNSQKTAYYLSKLVEKEKKGMDE